ncbi:MAG: hypothetical protein GY794_03785 [bacterium]|nr:hypothetical protein [bacterium]
MARFDGFDPKNLSSRIQPHLLEARRLRNFLDLVIDPADPKPVIADFQPWQGHAGTAVIIAGNNFSDQREENHVTIGGHPALVVEAATNRLLVISSPQTETGPVQVTVAGEIATGPRDFTKLAWPKPGTGDDGPPYAYAGRSAGGAPAAGTIATTGTARVLVVACNPTDLVPANAATARQAIVDAMANVTSYYDQVSYNTLAVPVDVTTHVSLLNNANYYHRANGAVGYPNIDNAVLGQLMAECAQGAVDQGFNLDDYEVLVASVFLPGLGVRAWGGWSSSNFAYDDGAGTVINITTTSPLALIAQRHDANWGRTAHEFAHGLLDGGLVLGEDVYASDLIDGSEATASKFTMMGNHDSHPLFSAFNMKQLGWYSGTNVVTRDWNRNPFSETFDIVAHDLAQDGDPARVHLVEIRMGAGLSYFIEVRQRPDLTSPAPAVFDENIPLPMGGGTDGGVVVTKAISGELNNNHQTRLITLLQDPDRVLITGEVVDDPLRTIVITVVDDNLQARPRVCRVRVEWAQNIADNPDGDFDLNIRPWGPGWETEDIWIDRMPYGSYDFTDASGDPTGNGDEPRPLEINRFYARVRNEGDEPANDVKVTHYAISPPGVGDNGSWSPLSTYTIGAIPGGGVSENFVNWVPLVGEHTCLKVAISQQLGEVTGANNQAQENVFNFQPAASSIAEPVVLTVAVRNPLKERALLTIALENVPRGYFVYFPHRWLWLDPLGEKKLDLLIIPLFDPAKPYLPDQYYESQKERKVVPEAQISLYGQVARVYSEELELTGIPASWMAPIGGVLARVEPKLRGKVELDPKIQDDDEVIIVHGQVDPKIRCQSLRVDMVAPDSSVLSVLTDTNDRGRFVARFSRPASVKVVAKMRTAHRLTERLVDVGKVNTAPGPDQRTNCPPDRNQPPKNDNDNGNGKENPYPRYAFQAHIINASKIAPTDSNIIYWSQS